MPRTIRGTSTILAVGTLALAGASPAWGIDEQANCLGEDRSDQGGFPTAQDFAQALVAQHEFDRLVGFPASTGQSIAFIAQTDCGASA